MLILYRRGNTTSVATKSYLDSVESQGGIIKSLNATGDMISALSTYNAWLLDPQASGYIVNKRVLVSKLFSIGQNIPLSQSTDTLQPVLGDFTNRKSLVTNKRFGVFSSGYALSTFTSIPSYSTIEIGFSFSTEYVSAVDVSGGSFSAQVSTHNQLLINFNDMLGNSILLFAQGDNGGTPTTIINTIVAGPANLLNNPICFMKLLLNYSALTYTFSSSFDNVTFTTLASGSIANFKVLNGDLYVNGSANSPTASTISSCLSAYLKIDGTTITSFNPYDCALNASSWSDTQGKSWTIQNHSGNNPIAGFVQSRNSMFYNGTTQYLTASTDPFFTFTGDFLISAVMKPSLWDASNPRMALLSTANNSSATTGFMLEFGSTDGFRLLNNGSTVLDDNVSSITGLTPKIAHYVTIQRSGTGSNNLQIYVDDVLRGQASYNGTIGASNSIYVGANSAAQAGTLGFTGEIPSICVINGTWDATIASTLRTFQTKNYQAV